MQKLLAVPLALVLGACAGSKAAAPIAAGPEAPAAAPAPAPREEPARGDERATLLALARVHFAFDSAALLPDARAALAEAATRLARHPELHLSIDGHADTRGPSAHNLGLSERRARAVVDALVAGGVPRDRLTIEAFGAERPHVSGTDALSHAMNRRVEYRLLRGDVELRLEDGRLVDDVGRPIERLAER